MSVEREGREKARGDGNAMRRLAVAVWLGVLAAACQSTYVVVTVDARTTVHGAASLSVTLGNAGMTATDAFQLAMHQFPVTFAVDATGRTGDLQIAVDALDTNMLLVGQGSGTSPISSAAASVTLDSADFVVNTELAGDQELSNDFEANGLQLGAEADGTWTVAFHDACDTPCDMDARRFAADGSPLVSMAAAGTNQFAMSTMQADGTSTEAMAGAGTFTMGFWDFESADLTQSGVACQAVDDSGNELSEQVAIGSDIATDVVSATAIGSNLFAVTWDSFPGSNQVIRAIVSDNTCTPVGATQTISSSGSDDSFRAHVAANGNDVLYAWLEGSGDVHVRSADSSNTLGTDLLMFPAGTTETIEHVRVTAMEDGFAVVVRWESLTSDTDPGRIELYKVDASGNMVFGPVLISGTTGSDINSVESFGVATRSDGAILVVWHACGTNGDGQGCGVFGRIVRPTGVPVGDQFVLATTLAGDQTAPAAVGIGSAFAVAWNDASDQLPDTSGLAVRARVIQPAYDDATGVEGAQCSQEQPCGQGLVCLAASDNVARCFETCTTTCADGGTCTGGGCVF